MIGGGGHYLERLTTAKPSSDQNQNPKARPTPCSPAGRAKASFVPPTGHLFGSRGPSTIQGFQESGGY